MELFAWVVYGGPFIDEFRLYGYILTVPVPTRGATVVFVKRD